MAFEDLKNFIKKEIEIREKMNFDIMKMNLNIDDLNIDNYICLFCNARNLSTKCNMFHGEYHCNLPSIILYLTRRHWAMHSTEILKLLLTDDYTGEKTNGYKLIDIYNHYKKINLENYIEFQCYRIDSNHQYRKVCFKDYTIKLSYYEDEILDDNTAYRNLHHFTNKEYCELKIKEIILKHTDLIFNA